MADYEEEFALSIKDPQSYWKRKADEIHWFSSPLNASVYHESKDGNHDQSQCQWFSDGVINACYNCVDVHVTSGYGERTAIIHHDDFNKNITKISYRELLDQVAKFAGVLKNHGVERGDRVLISMPNIPEASISMLSCARIGAIHVVVYSGYPPPDFARRIDHVKPKVVITASCGFEGLKINPYKSLMDDAIKLANYKPHKLIILQRKQLIASMNPEIDLDWQKEMESAVAVDCTQLKSTDLLYILYSSGTSGGLKGIAKDNGGHTVALKWFMTKMVGLQPGQVFFPNCSFGWLASHSLLTYGTLLAGGTALIYEGDATFTSGCEWFYKVLEEYEVSSAFSSVASIRMVRKHDPDGIKRKRYSFQKLQSISVSAECIDPEVTGWASDTFGVPVFGQWGQTETTVAGLNFTKEFGILPDALTYGSSGKPMPGWNACIIGEDGQECSVGEIGRLLFKLPLPPGTVVAVWEDEARYMQYFSHFKGYYDTDDVAMKDSRGFITIIGRYESMINVRGYKMPPSQLEQILAKHPLIIDQCVVAKVDEEKGFVPLGLIVIRAGTKDSNISKIISEVIQMVKDELGKVPCLETVVLVPRLPKTRSGKLLRKQLQALMNDQIVSIPEDNVEIFAELKDYLKKHGYIQG